MATHKFHLESIPEIKSAVDSGKTVYAGSESYTVIKKGEEYYIKSPNNMIGLHGAEGTEWEHKLNADDFYIIAETLIIVDSENFTGTIKSTLSNLEPLDEQLVHYTEFRWKEYKENHPSYILLTWPEFDEKYYQPHLKSLQKEWEEITEKRYDYLLEVLPPQRWTRGEYTFFYLLEAETADLHLFVMMHKGKYYSALRSKFIPDDELISGFKNYLESVKSEIV
jgi:hypothetical protein